MREKWRVAIASRDGKVINEHFGRAKEFLIVDIDREGSYEFIERRPVHVLCENGEHSDQGLLDSVAALSDCSIVLVARIGTGAKRALELNHISVFEQPEIIEDALAKLSRYLIKTNPA